MEFAFFQFKVELVFTELLEDEFDMVHMVFITMRIDKNVIDIYNDELVQVILENLDRKSVV